VRYVQSEVAGELLGCYNHELAFRLMQEFRLPMAPIYVDAIGKIAGRRQVSKIFDLLKNVKGSVDDRDWDEVVLAAVKVMVRDHNDPKTGEKLVDKLVYPQSKVSPSLTHVDDDEDVDDADGDDGGDV
jgi:zinc finger FYVE domain-containing protein 26